MGKNNKNAQFNHKYGHGSICGAPKNLKKFGNSCDSNKYI